MPDTNTTFPVAVSFCLLTIVLTRTTFITLTANLVNFASTIYFMMYAVKIKPFLFSYCMYNSILVFYIIHFSLRAVLFCTCCNKCSQLIQIGGMKYCKKSKFQIQSVVNHLHLQLACLLKILFFLYFSPFLLA